MTTEIGWIIVLAILLVSGGLMRGLRGHHGPRSYLADPIAETEVTPGVPASLRVTVPAGGPYSLWLHLKLSPVRGYLAYARVAVRIEANGVLAMEHAGFTASPGPRGSPLLTDGPVSVDNSGRPSLGYDSKVRLASLEFQEGTTVQISLRAELEPGTIADAPLRALVAARRRV